MTIAMNLPPSKDNNGNFTVLGKVKNPEKLVCERGLILSGAGGQWVKRLGQF